MQHGDDYMQEMEIKRSVGIARSSCKATTHNPTLRNIIDRWIIIIVTIVERELLQFLLTVIYYLFPLGSRRRIGSSAS